MRPAVPSPRAEPARAWIAAAVWLACASAGLVALAGYGGRAGAARSAPAEWPAPPGVELDAALPTLVMFAHPRCPCTRATLGELERLVAEVGGALRVHVLFHRPPDAAEGWERTDLWSHAERLPNAHVAADAGGALARTFGAETSGHVVVYDPSGRLAFSGGITMARAHEGYSRGRAAVVRLALEGTTSEPCTPVFGCALVRPPEPQ